MTEACTVSSTYKHVGYKHTPLLSAHLRWRMQKQLPAKWIKNVSCNGNDNKLLRASEFRQLGWWRCRYDCNEQRWLCCHFTSSHHYLILLPTAEKVHSCLPWSMLCVLCASSYNQNTGNSAQNIVWNNMLAYHLSFSRPTMVLLKPHLGVSGVPFMNSMTGSRVISCLSRSSRLTQHWLSAADGNIVWNSPLVTSSFMMSSPPTSSPRIYSCGYVGQLEYSFKPASQFKLASLQPMHV